VTQLSDSVSWNELALFTPDGKDVMFMSSRDHPGFFNTFAQIAHDATWNLSGAPAQRGATTGRQGATPEGCSAERLEPLDVHLLQPSLSLQYRTPILRFDLSQKPAMATTGLLSGWPPIDP
jgi:hypothetical protein